MERVIFENSQVRVVEFKNRYFVDEDSDGKYVVFIEDRVFDLNAWDSPKYLVESICNSINMEEA